MIRCSPRRIRDPTIAHLKARFEDELERNPMPKRKRHLAGTDTPVDIHKQITRRHAAVLGLGALIEAFPYATPPPEWMPEVLAMLARKAAADPGVVGKATKTILSEFKKTRQDSWTVDQKVCLCRPFLGAPVVVDNLLTIEQYFTPEQLEDLEGVLWKSYFA
jgi:proteasome activator subunit 4